MSRVVTGAWWVWLLLALGALGGLAAARRDPAWRRRWHAWRRQLPIVGDIEQQVWVARWARALGVLLEGGTPMLRALRVAGEGVDNVDLAARLDAGTARVERGERLSAALTGVLPPLATQLISVGEESGTLGPMATRIADTADREVQRRLRTLAGLVEPVLIVLFGGLVGFVALAMLQAIYAINTNVL